jgi:cbb3-type cytochrome oxidase subunit 3
LFGGVSSTFVFIGGVWSVFKGERKGGKKKERNCLIWFIFDAEETDNSIVP